MPLSRRTLLLGAATWAGVGGHAAWRRRRTPSAGVRVVSWNLRNFSGLRTATSRYAPGHDLERLAGHLKALDADVFCFQEVLEPDALAGVLPGHRVEASTSGGAHGQRLVVARRPDIVAEAAQTHPCTALQPRLRPVLQQRLRLGDTTWSIVLVHLKAGRDGYRLRGQQRAALLEYLRGVPRPRLVVGDFNTTGAKGSSPQLEIASLADAFDDEGLRRVAPTVPCTAYWEGSRFDRFEEASILDHVFIEGASPNAPAVQAAPGTLCARHRCSAFSSTDAYPDLDYERVSDHCPITIDLGETAVS